MILYLIESTACMTLLIAAFKLFYEKEKIPVFNRLLLSVTLPLLNIPFPHLSLFPVLQLTPPDTFNFFPEPSSPTVCLMNSPTQPLRDYSSATV